MTFTLNAGEFDLGAGLVGRGTLLTAETYSVLEIQGLVNTSGLEGEVNSFNVLNDATLPNSAVFFRASSDALTSTIATVTSATANNVIFAGDPIPTGVRFCLATYLNWTGGNNIWSHSLINSSSTTTPVKVYGSGFYDDPFGTVYFNASNWRYLARDQATALVHYPSTLVDGSMFSASCLNSATQWGLWIAGEVGNRSGYFNQTQGYFSIVILRNGSDWHISAFTPAAANSISRNDNVIRSFNIVPAPGQTGADRFSEFFIARDLGNGFSETIGKVPGFIYVDMNQAANSALTVGSLLEITPGVGTTYDLTNHGAIVVAQWGLDISATVSNVGSTFTVDTASTPSSASLSSLNRTRTTLEENQRIQITATPPTGLSTATNYWVKNWNPTAFTFKLSATEGGATIVPSSNTNSTITRYAGLIAMPCYQA